jgi:hypothetical protein
MKRLTRFAFLCLLWVGVLLSSAGGLRGQMVTFTGSPVDFGNINICQGAKTTPAPCSASMTLNYKVTVNGTLGTPRVLTLGAFGGDFSPVSSTCKGPMTAGSTCVVQVKFAPLFPGLRPGAVEIIDGSGNVVTTTLSTEWVSGRRSRSTECLRLSWSATRMPTSFGVEWRSMGMAICFFPTASAPAKV